MSKSIEWQEVQEGFGLVGKTTYKARGKYDWFRVYCDNYDLWWAEAVYYSGSYPWIQATFATKEEAKAWVEKRIREETEDE